MNSLSTNSKTYQKLTKDPTPSLERKMSEMLLQLKKSGSITSSLNDKLRSSGGCLPLLNGLPIKSAQTGGSIAPTHVVPAVPHVSQPFVPLCS